LFEIRLHPGDCAAVIDEYSEHPSECKILIAASSVFIIDEVEYIDIDVSVNDQTSGGRLTLPLVKLSCSGSWSEFDIEKRPTTVVADGQSPQPVMDEINVGNSDPLKLESDDLMSISLFLSFSRYIERHGNKIDEIGQIGQIELSPTGKVQDIYICFTM
jgi:hypothetical protein